MDAEIGARSSIPGRLRADVPAVRSRPALARALEAGVASLPYVTAARANPTLGSILVTYDPAVSAEAVLAELGAQLLAIDDAVVLTDEGGTDGSPLQRILAQALPPPEKRIAPVVLSVGDNTLTVLQGLSFVAIVNVARGDPSPILRTLHINHTNLQLATLTASTVVLTAGELWVQYHRRKAWQRLAQSTQHALRTQLFDHVLAQDMPFFDEYSVGHLQSLLSEDVGRIAELVERGDVLIQSLLTVLVGGAALVRTSPRLAIVAAITLPIAAVPTRALRVRATRSASRRTRAAGDLNQITENVLSGIVEVKSFTAEQQESERVTTRSRDLAEASVNATSASVLQSVVTQSIVFSGQTVATAQGGRLAAAGRLPQDAFSRTFFWFPRLMRALGDLSESAGLYWGAGTSADKLCQVLDRGKRAEWGVRRPARTRRAGEVRIEDVSFEYRPSVPVLRNVSLLAPAGATIGIVGRTGSGKSTLLRLLMRFYEPASGRILLHGRDVRNIDEQELRAAIGLVSQEVYLFDGTVRHNILYGRRDANERDVRRAAEVAGVADLLGTDVGERGHRLSGGQRQRVAIARAVLKNPQVLALDEATSHLDYETEAEVKAALKEAMRGKTVISVAHRLSTVRDADTIVVLDQGAVLEQGDHASLLTQGGLYHRLWELQAG